MRGREEEGVRSLALGSAATSVEEEGVCVVRGVQ